MIKNLLVEIFVSTKDGQGHIATGYPIAKNRILTAWHVLSPSGADHPESVEVRWHHQIGATREWRAASIVWHGGDMFDAALIGCDFPEDLLSWGFLSEARPNEQMKWV